MTHFPQSMTRQNIWLHLLFCCSLWTMPLCQVMATDAVVVDATGNTTVAGTLTVQGAVVSAPNMTLTRTADAGLTEVVRGNDTRLLTPWTLFTPVIKGVGATPLVQLGAYTSKCSWRREGSDMLIQFYYSQTAPATNAGSGVYRFEIPGGYTIDSSRCVFGTSQSASTLGSVVGAGQAVMFGTTAGYCAVFTLDTTALGLMASGSTYILPASSSFYSLAQSSIHFGFTARVPIQGW